VGLSGTRPGIVAVSEKDFLISGVDGSVDADAVAFS
jgi:hypothetical protein